MQAVGTLLQQESISVQIGFCFETRASTPAGFMTHINFPKLLE